MAQFRCEVCGDGFEQQSAYERHVETSHPPRAPSAADVEKALAGIQYPKAKEELISYASRNVTTKAVEELLNSLPSRTYRDSAEVAIAIGEIKKAKGVRGAEEVAQTETPSTKGGKTAATKTASSAAVAKVLSGVDFPKGKKELRDYAAKHANESGIDNPENIVEIIDRLPDKEFTNMADIEKSVSLLT